MTSTLNLELIQRSYQEARKKMDDIVTSCRTGSFIPGLVPNMQNIFKSISAQVADGTIDPPKLSNEVDSMTKFLDGTDLINPDLPCFVNIYGSLMSLHILPLQKTTENLTRFVETRKTEMVNCIDSILFEDQLRSDKTWNGILMRLECNPGRISQLYDNVIQAIYYGLYAHSVFSGFTNSSKYVHL